MERDRPKAFDTSGYMPDIRKSPTNFRVALQKPIPRLTFILCIAALWPGVAGASYPNTPAAMGEVGLNTIPSARFDPVGTVRVQLSRLHPYSNGNLGLQVAQPLYINIRQTAESRTLFSHADRLFPGIDLKGQLHGETAHSPAVALGLQGAAGDARMAGEYVALSKRFNNFDFTGGFGWGRFASGGHITNPLRALSGYFGKHRPQDANRANEPDDWFTGRHIGLMAGIAWDSPVDGLTLKADWGQDRFATERADDTGRNHSDPWSLGFSYSPRPWVTIGTALVGGNAIYGSLSFQSPLQGWPGRPAHREAPIEPFPAYRTGEPSPAAVDVDASGHGFNLASIKTEWHTLISRLLLKPGASLPQQVGQAVRPMAIHGGADTDSYIIQPAVLGEDGPSIRLNRRDLEQALASHNGSPQEIWRHTEFGPAIPASHFPSPLTFIDRPGYLTLLSDTETSLSEQDHGVLYRTSLIGDYKYLLTTHLVVGQALRLNLADNLKNLNENRPIDILPVRSDEDRFAARRLSYDRNYLSYMTSFNRDWHMALTGGYLEEMYGGAGGEVLYRPFGRTYGFGAEIWEALKRSPDATLNLGFNGDHLLTGHLKAYYEVPGTDMTLQAKVGRYLAEDVGGTLALSNSFRNGVSIEAFVTVTDLRDRGAFGGSTPLYSGLRIRLPLGNIPHVPAASEARVTVAPIGRDAGQSIDNPLPLYDLTNQFSYRTIADHWTDITD